MIMMEGLGFAMRQPADRDLQIYIFFKTFGYTCLYVYLICKTQYGHRRSLAHYICKHFRNT